MNDDLINAKALLDDKGYSCVLCREEKRYVSSKTGISPILDLLLDKTDLQGYCVADKIVGKAAALLFALAGVKAVYGRVMSRRAADVFRRYGIDYFYDTFVDQIINRQGTGPCPMEEAVAAIEEPSEAFSVLVRKGKPMRGEIDR